VHAEEADAVPRLMSGVVAVHQHGRPVIDGACSSAHVIDVCVRAGEDFYNELGVRSSPGCARDLSPGAITSASSVSGQ